MLLLLLPALAQADLWVPPQMIGGEQYRGLVVLDEPSEAARTVLLSSDNPRVAGVPGSVRVPPHSNHGVFEIEAGADGAASVSAVVEGRLLSQDVQVASRPDGPASLHITLPSESAHAGTLTGYVTVLDATGAPAASGADVRLTSSGGISAPSRVEVPPGRFQAPFWVGISGDGRVTADAPGLAPHTASVRHERADIDVRIAVAPRAALADSHAFYHVWLERDGRPFKPPRALEAFLHTGDLDVGRMSPAHGGGTKVLLAGGVAHGILYTGERGTTTITASVPGVGTAQDVLLVGPARMSGGPDNTPELREDSGARAGPPNLILSWIYPSVTDGGAWAVAAAYDSQVRRSLAADGSGIREESVLVPARLPGGTVHVASGPGLEHAGTYPLLEKTTKTNAVQFPVTGTVHGLHSLRASGQGMDSGNNAEVRVARAHSGDLGVWIAPLPALPGAEQDLALVSLVDGDAATDPSALLGSAEFSVSAVSARLSSGTAVASGSTAVVTGTLTGTGSITASLKGVGSSTVPIEPAGLPAPPELWVPARVRAGEPFPFVVHGAPGGAPVPAPPVTGASSPLGASLQNGMLVLEQPGRGQISVVTEAGAAASQIEAFENPMNLQLYLSGTDFRVGGQLTLEAASLAGSEYNLDTALPFERAGPNTFLVTVDREGESLLSVTAEREGYAPATASATVSGRLVHGLEAAASDLRGNPLHPEFLMTGGASQSLVAPYATELPPGPVTVEFPAEHREAGRGYLLSAMMLDGERAGLGVLELNLAGDARVDAVYERQVLVSVEGGLGSGTYGEGETVRVSAPDRPVVWFLVREVFDRWEGLESDSAEYAFAASQDISIRAVYRQDWTHLLLALALPLAGAAVLSFVRGSTRLRWSLEQLLERKFGR